MSNYEKNLPPASRVSVMWYLYYIRPKWRIWGTPDFSPLGVPTCHLSFILGHAGLDLSDERQIFRIRDFQGLMGARLTGGMTVKHKGLSLQ